MPRSAPAAARVARGAFMLVPLVVALTGCGNDADTVPRTTGERAAAGGENIIVAKGCQQCHSIERLGISAVSAIGPDLSNAAVNVPSRYGRDLATFMDRPSGTMQLVLTQQIVLSAAERDSVVALLTRIRAGR